MNPVLGFSLLHIAVIGGFVFNLALRENSLFGTLGWIALIAGQIVLFWAYLAEVRKRRAAQKREQAVPAQ